jgi:hypothetical protein
MFNLHTSSINQSKMKQITEEVVEEFSSQTNFVIFTNNPQEIQLIENISKKYSKKFNFFHSNDSNLSGLKN